MEIKEYWPRHLQELVEFGQIATAEQPEFTKAVQDVQGAPDDFFLVSLSEYGCRRWEAILGLVASAEDTVESRRERILIAYLDQLPYTYRALMKYLSTVSDDFKVVLDNDAYELFVRIRLSGYTQRDALAETLKQMIPANLVFKRQSHRPSFARLRSWGPLWSIWSATNTTQKEETRMARFKSTITDRGAEVLTAFLAAGKRLVLVSAAAGDGVAQVSPNTLTALVNPINVNAQIGEKTFVESNPSYMRIPVQITNAGLESAQYVREVATFALDEKDAPFMFSYSWLDGADSDNILPPDSFLGRAGMDGDNVLPATTFEEDADTVHIHDVAVVVTNQENSGITVEVGNGSFVTTAQMVAYSAPIVHGHAASDVQESTGESVESVQRRQDFDISAIREQLDTGFAGTAVTHTFATAQLNQWKGYDGTGLPEGILDTAKNRLYL